MNSQLNKSENSFSTFLSTPEGREAARTVVEQMRQEKKNAQMFHRNQMKRINRWIKKNDKKGFNELMKTLIAKHEGDYVLKKCYGKGLMPFPNIVLSSVINFAMKEGRKLKPIVKYWDSERYKYGNYIFQVAYTAMGTVFAIFLAGNKEPVLNL